MVSLAFMFDKEVADFLNSLTRQEVRQVRLVSKDGVRAFQIHDDDGPTEDYAACLEFPDATKEDEVIDSEIVH